ncbi:MAG: stage 0 sporulation family protein [Clostridia bacterium]|nr:stage 0 sporulation family protein [Clostridia bacterium]
MENNQNKKNNKKRYYHHNKKKNKKNEIAENQATEVIEESVEIEEAPENLEFLEDIVPEAFEAPAPKKERDPNEEQVEVVGVRFKKVGKVYYFAPEKIQAQKGDFAIVDTARGPEFGEVFIANKSVGISEIVPPLRSVIRIATKEDISHNEENAKKEKEAFGICLEQIAKHGLDMKLVDAQYTFDNSKLLFYFTSAGRVDFRELVKDLAAVFRTRIELRQIGIRDEAKLVGGLGACGRPLCCATFLSDFVQVSIKMAKEQGLFLNSQKISGTCGRLMCCLRYEQESYEYEMARTPAVDSQVKTPDGVGTVTESRPLTGLIKVKITNKDGESIKVYHRDDVKLIISNKKSDKE